MTDEEIAKHAMLDRLKSDPKLRELYQRARRTQCDPDDETLSPLQRYGLEHILRALDDVFEDEFDIFWGDL